MKNTIYQKSPHVLQNILISLFNIIEYKKRYGGKYTAFRKIAKDNSSLSLIELQKIQNEKFIRFIIWASHHSPFYKDKFAGLKLPDSVSAITQLPLISKEDFKKNINAVHTIKRNEGLVAKTGGTTGVSMEVVYTPENMQERFAMLDHFRSQFGYQLGKKTAWFSGKSLLNNYDIKNNRFWKTDHVHKVRYYSTFHIKEEFLKFYVEDLITFQPQYLVGYPSTLFEIAKYGTRNGYHFPKKTVKAIFPTSETVTNEMRIVIGDFFHTVLPDQYASSEGAPFIFQCSAGKLHLELQSGVFEVLDEMGNPANSGRLVVTSFTTYGTPLIRYEIGDTIALENSEAKCNCGNNNPLVKEILGRVDDFIFSPEVGKINLVNVANSSKGTHGIVKFQVLQNKLNELQISMVTDTSFTAEDEKVFLKNWRERVGNTMQIEIKKVADISVEKSGKFRIVKNNIKHLL